MASAKESEAKTFGFAVSGPPSASVLSALRGASESAGQWFQYKKSCRIACQTANDAKAKMQQIATETSKTRNGTINAVQKQDLPIHAWYRFVLSYPPHLVRQYMSAFGVTRNDLLLDPFCGTGTTLVDARILECPV